MTNNVNKFIGTLRPIKNRLFKGYRIMIKVRIEEIVKWNIEENNGRIHSIMIHNIN